jgi:hypothetical protein
MGIYILLHCCTVRVAFQERYRCKCCVYVEHCTLGVSLPRTSITNSIINTSKIIKPGNSLRVLRDRVCLYTYVGTYVLQRV